MYSPLTLRDSKKKNDCNFARAGREPRGCTARYHLESAKKKFARLREQGCTARYHLESANKKFARLREQDAYPEDVQPIIT